MAKTNYVKKLSVSTISAMPTGFKKQPNGYQVAIMQVIGRIEKIETGVSQFGEWTAFTGSFKAVKLEDGEVFRASKCLLPDIATDALKDAVEGANGGIVEFAIEIGMRRTVKVNAQGEETGIGYEYSMRPLIDIDEAADPLAVLEARAGLAALPAPAPDLVEQAKADETKADETKADEAVEPAKPAKSKK